MPTCVVWKIADVDGIRIVIVACLVLDATGLSHDVATLVGYAQPTYVSGTGIVIGAVGVCYAALVVEDVYAVLRLVAYVFRASDAIVTIAGPFAVYARHEIDITCAIDASAVIWHWYRARSGIDVDRARRLLWNGHRHTSERRTADFGRAWIVVTRTRKRATRTHTVSGEAELHGTREIITLATSAVFLRVITTYMYRYVALSVRAGCE